VEHCENAFADLVREHVYLVYWAALREANGEAAQAEDISQAVFTELARQANRLLSHPSLAGWHYTTVRCLAANLRRADLHRSHRELETHD
jgi:DNA-directed RNA polymerase specialized sigma24 family protein